MKLNPHGDMAIYETMVRLTTGNGALLHPGGIEGELWPSVFKRYEICCTTIHGSEAGNIAAELFQDIDKDTVDFVDNYDATMKEPTLLPSVSRIFW